jgi:serine/threonine protein kinase
LPAVRDGDRIGPYRVLRRIGEGGMGVVYLGEHTLIGRLAAVKVLLPEMSAERVNVDRFFNEARATTAVSDPGIVQVFDFGVTADNRAYIVMELLEGEPLNQRLDRLGAMSPADALRIARQVAGSLAAAHAAGIVHRDLKPDNLFMIRDPEAPGGERPKILDFGIAKLADDVPDRIKTRTGAVLGTPMYMSPEQCSGAGNVDHRADIYALGCVLFHLTTGRPPFDLPGLGDIISAHLREPPPVPSSIVSSISPELDGLVLRCLAKAPDQRYATMLELQQACDAILARMPASAARISAMSSLPVPRTPQIAPPRTTLSLSAGQPTGSVPRRRIGVWVGLLALAGATGIVGAVVSRGDAGEPRPAATAPRPEPEAAAKATVDAGVAPDPAPIATVPTVAPDAAIQASEPPPREPFAAGGSGAEPAAPAIRNRAEGVKSRTPKRKAQPATTRNKGNEDLYDDRN